MRRSVSRWFLCLGFLACLLAQNGIAQQWPRAIDSGKGARTDMASPHPLQYFTAEPLDRDDGGDFCEACTPSKRDIVASTEVRPIGALGGFDLIDVLYRFRVPGDSDAQSADVKWKSILVKIAPRKYIEIYHLQAFYTSVSLSPSQIVRVGAESVLVTMDPDGGNGGGCWDGYWWFDKEGPHQVDFSALYDAIRTSIPRAAIFATRCSAIRWENQTIDAEAFRDGAPCRVCGQLGEAVAEFRLEQWRAIPVNVRFVPNSNP